jgi:hypothetical protein
MSPDDLKRQLAAATSQSSGQQQYYFKVRAKTKRRLVAFGVWRLDACDAPLRPRRRPKC